jgi:hypothetical protein
MMLNYILGIMYTINAITILYLIKINMDIHVHKEVLLLFIFKYSSVFTRINLFLLIKCLHLDLLNYLRWKMFCI